MEALIKSGDFVADVRAGYYRGERNLAHHDKSVKSTWNMDFRAFLLENGIPEQYVGKVADYAYEHGHANGEEGMLSYAEGLIEIFKV